MRGWITLVFVLCHASIGSAQLTVKGQKSPRSERRILVGFKPGVDRGERVSVLKTLGLEPAEEIRSLGVVVAQPSQEEFRTAAVARISQHPSILTAEEDVWIQWDLEDAPAGSFHQTPMPSLGELSGQLPSFKREELGDREIPWGVRRVNAPTVWAKNRGEGVRVAVIDTGVDFRHPDLAPNLSGGLNTFDEQAPPLDDQGHGTAMAGIVAAVKDGRGVVGVAPKAKLYAVKVADATGGGRLSNMIEGILWCADQRMHVANISMGMKMDSAFLNRAIKYAVSRGVTIVAAAGNSGRTVDPSVSYPAAYPEVIAVSAGDPNDQIAGFSSRGPEIDFLAPGVQILSAEMGGGTAAHSGTSPAAPHVAGLAALAVAQGAKSPAAVRSALDAAAVKVSGLGPAEQGAGVIDAARLIHKAR